MSNVPSPTTVSPITAPLRKATWSPSFSDFCASGRSIARTGRRFHADKTGQSRPKTTCQKRNGNPPLLNSGIASPHQQRKNNQEIHCHNHVLLSQVCRCTHTHVVGDFFHRFISLVGFFHLAKENECKNQSRERTSQKNTPIHVFLGQGFRVAISTDEAADLRWIQFGGFVSGGALKRKSQRRRKTND